MKDVGDLLDRLHDAVLETVELDWAAAIVRVRLRLCVAAGVFIGRAVRLEASSQ